jgi:hypothetical protein
MKAAAAAATAVSKSAAASRTGSGRPGSGRVPALASSGSQGKIGTSTTPNKNGSTIEKAAPVDIKKEKENTLLYIAQEIKSYDLEEMKTDVNYKLAKIVNDLKKSERLIINDEKRNIRQIEKLEHMEKAL